MKIKQIIISLSLAFAITSAVAETCPDVNTIKHSELTGWKIVDSDDGTPLNETRIAEFKNSIVEFLLAEWKGKKHNGAIHCYYRDQDGANMEAYLIKEKIDTDNNKHYWYRVSGFMHCAASMESCEFRKLPFSEKNKQLASN